MALEYFAIAVAFLVGSGLGWVLRRINRKSSFNNLPPDEATQVAAAHARVEELRAQLSVAKEEADGLRDRLRLAEMARSAAETRAIEMEKHLVDQRDLLEDAKAKLSDTFKSLAADALARNNRGFLTLAEEKFKALKEEASVDLDHRRREIESLVQPLADSMVIYQKEAKELEEKRLQDLSAVGEQLRQLASSHGTLQAETAKLVNALRTPHVRGRWGEIALRKTAELAGMSPHCDFVEQASVETENGRLRPDMIVKLPAGREVVVDSKVPLSAFLESLEAKTDEERQAALTRHASHVRQHVTKLAAKEYWDQFADAPEFVVLFIPNDTFLAAAAEEDPELVETALTKRIVIATPTTFIALLRAVAYGWRQERIAESAHRIELLGQELYDRMGILIEHLLKIGNSLGRAVDSYNAAVGSLESRILPSARKFKLLGATNKKDLEELQPIDQRPRSLSPSDSIEASEQIEQPEKVQP
jgi:DNA recombination protein RmuC